MERLLEAKGKLQINFELKDKQVETLTHLTNGRDCIAILPTGYGKSVIPFGILTRGRFIMLSFTVAPRQNPLSTLHNVIREIGGSVTQIFMMDKSTKIPVVRVIQLLPWLLRRGDRPGMVVVVCPLSSIIEDQVTSLARRGVRTGFINITGTSFVSFDEENDLDRKLIHTDIEKIRQAELDILYSHPEALFSPRIQKILRSSVFRDVVCCIAVDEVHMIAEWGEKFRPSFRKLGDIVCLFPEAVHLAMTATATEDSIPQLIQTLQLSNPAIVKVNPDRPNIFIEVKERLPNIRKFDKLDGIISPLAKELAEKLTEFPVTIVYVESLESLGYFYQFLNYTLKERQYDGPEIPENRIFAQYHKDYTKSMKSHIIRELQKEQPKLRLVLATVALGMGLNSPSVTRVIHCRPPTTLQKYMQEIGRAGRDGQKCYATLYYNNSDLASNRKGLSPAVVEFCRNKHSCLRRHLLLHFGFSDVVYTGAKSECCSNCKYLLA